MVIKGFNGAAALEVEIDEDATEGLMGIAGVELAGTEVDADAKAGTTGFFPLAFDDGGGKNNPVDRPGGE